MDPLTLAMVAALAVFVIVLARGGGFWKALGAGSAVMLVGFVLTMALVALSVMVAGLSIFAVLGSLVLGPVLLLLAPVFLVIGLFWLIGASRRNSV